MIWNLFAHTGLSLRSPANIRFKYRLEGLESGWNDVGTERKAIYRHVPPGRYVFHVIACNSDALWSMKSARCWRVQVNPFFYQTAWFRIIAGLLTVIGLSFTVAIAMRRRLRRHMEQLEHQHELERERSRIAQDLHDDLGAGLTEIGLLGAMATNPAIPPNEKEQYLCQLNESARSLVTGLDEIVWAVNPHYDSIGSLITYSSLFAQRFLNLAGIACRLQIIEPFPERPAGFQNSFRHGIFLACKEALNNVVRHSQAKEVEIKMEVAENQLMISIRDNGRGMESASCPGQDGLVGMHERLRQIGGECQINSQLGEGTNIIFRIRLNKMQP